MMIGVFVCLSGKVTDLVTIQNRNTLISKPCRVQYLRQLSPSERTLGGSSLEQASSCRARKSATVAESKLLRIKGQERAGRDAGQFALARPNGSNPGCSFSIRGKRSDRVDGHLMGFGSTETRFLSNS